MHRQHVAPGFVFVFPKSSAHLRLLKGGGCSAAAGGGISEMFQSLTEPGAPAPSCAAGFSLRIDLLWLAARRCQRLPLALQPIAHGPPDQPTGAALLLPRRCVQVVMQFPVGLEIDGANCPHHIRLRWWWR